MVRNRESKMVVLLAAALALGVGAVAACVVPWFYCKPPDADDDTREATVIRDRTDPGPHSRSVVEETSTPAPNVRITGISYVRFVVPPTPTSSFVSAMSTSATQDSAILNACCENPATAVDRRVQGKKIETIQRSDDADPMTSGLINPDSVETETSNQENSDNLSGSKKSVTKSAARSSGSEIGNSDVSHPGFADPVTTRVKVTIRNVDKSSLTLPISDSSNPTEESSTDPTNRTQASTSASESKTTRSLTFSSTYPDSSALASSTKTEETSSTIPTTSEPSNPTSDLSKPIFDPPNPKSVPSKPTFDPPNPTSEPSNPTSNPSKPKSDPSTSTSDPSTSTSDPSNPTDESSTSTSDRTSTSRSSATSSPGPARVATIAVIESARMSDPLETIREISTSPSFEPSPKFPGRLDHVASKIVKTPKVWFGNESTISTSTRKTERSAPFNVTPFVPGNPGNEVTPDFAESALRNYPEAASTNTSGRSRCPFNVPFVRPVPLNGTPFVPGNPGKLRTPHSAESGLRNHPDCETTKTLKRSRYPLFGRIKKTWRELRSNATPQSDRSKGYQNSSHQDSLKSLSAVKLPAGHSTMMSLMSEEDRLLESIRTRRSPRILPTCSMMVFDDPVDLSSDLNHPVEVTPFAMEVNEEPLDLSIRSSSDPGSEKAVDTTTRRRSSAESCKQILREVTKGLFRVRKSSKSSDEGVSHSNSLTICGDVSNGFKDENHNVRSTTFDKVKVEGTGISRRDSDSSRIDGRCLPRSNGLPRRIKKFLHIGSRGRGKGNAILTSLPKRLDDVPVEFQRNSTGTSSRLKRERNVRVDGSPDSSTDVTSFYELGITMSDSDRHRDVPCTSL